MSEDESKKEERLKCISATKLSFDMRLWGDYLEDVLSIEELKKAKTLYISVGNDISALRHCSQLEVLFIHSKTLWNITPLEDCENLKVLGIDCPEAECICPLESCTQLKELYLKKGTKVHTYEPLMWCPELTLLRDENCDAVFNSLRFMNDSEDDIIQELRRQRSELRLVKAADR